MAVGAGLFDDDTFGCNNCVTLAVEANMLDLMVHNLVNGPGQAGNVAILAVTSVLQQLGQPLLALLAKSSEYLRECQSIDTIVAGYKSPAESAYPEPGHHLHKPKSKHRAMLQPIQTRGDGRGTIGRHI